MNNIYTGRTFRIAFGITALMIMTLVQGALADDWTMFHHDAEHTGTSADTVEPPLSLLWKYQIGPSDTTSYHASSPAVSGGVVYVGSVDDNVYALDAATGTLKWKYTTGGGVYSSPAVSGSMVYVGSMDGNVYALDAATGALKWSYTTTKGIAISSSPTVSGSVVYVGSSDGYVYALDATTGTLIWKYTLGNPVDESPAVSGGVVYVGATGTLAYNMYALDAATGALKWKYNTDSIGSSSPAISGGVVYVGSNCCSGSQNVYALDAATGALKWSYYTSGVMSSPAVSGGVVYVGAVYSPNIYALDAATGALKWSYTTGDFVEFSSPAISGGVVYVGSKDKNIYALDAATGTLKWKYTTGGGVYSSPAVSGSMVYVGSNDGYIYAFKSNNPPVAVPGGPYIVNEGSAVAFDGSKSYDPDAGDSIASYAWDFGDGSTDSIAKPTHTYANNGVYTVKLTVTDTHGATNTATTSATVNNVAPTVNAGPAATINEGGTFSSSGSFTDPAPAGSAETYTATVDYGDGSGVQPLTLTGNTFALSHIYGNMGAYTVKVAVTDSSGGTGPNIATVTVKNVAPTVTITGPPVGSIYPVNTGITFTGTYSDPGMAFADTFTAQWTFDTTINTPVQTVSGGVVSTPYTFTAAGVYNVKLAVTDKDGGVGTATQINGADDFVVIYDPSAGFVTGGGWINSPAGAYTADKSLTGRANFGFVSKYQKGATVPTGETEFDFQMGNLNFHSTSYDWLVVSGTRAQYQGSGTINGAGNYRFKLTASDAQITGGGTTDGFRIQITDITTGNVVYDNEPGSTTDDITASPLEPISGGDIVIHTK